MVVASSMLLQEAGAQPGDRQALLTLVLRAPGGKVITTRRPVCLLSDSRSKLHRGA
jgi:hypothetical protein